jgi:hypothetical protein
LTTKSHNARCFGLDWHSDIALEYFDTVAEPGSGDVVHVSHAESLPPRLTEMRLGRTEIGGSGFRFSWNEEVSFDCDGSRIIWSSGADWKGKLPDSFYSSVAGLTLALRGMLALHASSIVLDGRAWLISGKAGAGKSTLVAELLNAGSELLADDLSAVSVTNGQAVAYRGRPAMRLHPDTAAHIAATRIDAVPHDPRGKLLVWPNARATDQAWPVAGAILLGGDEAFRLPRIEAAAAMTAMMFRPKISSRLAGHAQRRAALIGLAAAIETWRFPPLEAFGKADRRRRLAAVLQIMHGEGVSS